MKNPKNPGETQTNITDERDKTVDDQAVCVKAPEWAEHQRLWDDDLPCDDGRSGNIDADDTEKSGS
ncbi:MAG: hypothetical protein R6V60_18605 [Desulfobacterales bacterium]